MKGKLLILLVLCALVLATIACGGSGGNVRIVNELSLAVCFVQMSPSTDPTWGDDWLGPDEVISPGASRSFDVPTGAPYDVRVSACPDGMTTLGTWMEVPITSSRTTLTVR